LKILIVRFSSIGDIVLTSPVVRIAKEQLKAEVHFLTKKRYSNLVQFNPNIDKVHLFDSDFSGLIDDLKKEDFDHIIDLHNNLRTLRLKKALKKHHSSFYKANIEKWLLVNFKINRLPNKHIVDRYLETLSFLDVKNDGKGLDFFYSKNEVAIIPNLPPKYLCISLGAAHQTKQIPLNKLNEVIDLSDTSFVLIGGSDVMEAGKSLKAKKPNVLDLTGKLSIEASAHVINNSLGLITGDTGMMHIGAALKKKMVILWGNTISEFGMAPYFGENDINHFNAEIPLPCRPCSKIGKDKCPKGHFKCMEDHDMKRISKRMKLLFGL